MSAEFTMKVVKLTSARYLDHLPTQGDRLGHAFRDRTLEAELLEASRGFGSHRSIAVGRLVVILDPIYLGR